MRTRPATRDQCMEQTSPGEGHAEGELSPPAPAQGRETSGGNWRRGSGEAAGSQLCSIYLKIFGREHWPPDPGGNQGGTRE